MNSETICAPATIPGCGAISVIRVSGASAFAVADKIIKLKSGTIADSAGNSVRFGLAMDGEQVVDEVLASVFRSPLSYTGEDSVEISCHASAYVAERIVQLLCDAGARLAEPGEFTRRAFVNGKLDLAQAEAVADLISSASEAQHRIAVNQLRGGYSAQLEEIRGKLLEITSLMELELDFSEEDVEFADRSKLKGLVSSTIESISTLAESFRLGNAVRNGVPVVIAGKPNSGKSTLLNSILGEQRALVSDVPGTTRDTVEEQFVINGIQFRFIDTAGLRDTEETVEKMGIERTKQMISRADIVIGMVDATQSIEAILQDAAELVDMVDASSQKFIMALNKCDIAEKSDQNNIVNCINKDVLCTISESDIIFISAQNASDVTRLKNQLYDTQSARFASLTSSSALVTNVRHYTALQHAASSLQRVLDGLGTSLPTDLISQDLRESIYHLGSITGKITEDEVLGEVFGRFCIGK